MWKHFYIFRSYFSGQQFKSNFGEVKAKLYRVVSKLIISGRIEGSHFISSTAGKMPYKVMLRDIDYIGFAGLSLIC